MRGIRAITIGKSRQIRHPIRDFLADLETAMCTETSSLAEATSQEEEEIRSLAERLSAISQVSIVEAIQIITKIVTAPRGRILWVGR